MTALEQSENLLETLNRIYVKSTQKWEETH